MSELPQAIAGLDDKGLARVMLYQSGRQVHIALDGLGLQDRDDTLTALAGLNSTPGLVTQTAADTFVKRSLAGPAAGIAVTNADGVAGNPTIALANDLASVEGLAANGIAARTADDTWAVRTITGPAAGVVVTNGDGVAGNPTISLSADLAAVEGLAANGIAARTGTNTWTVRIITGTADEITVTNGDGVAGNPTISLPASMTFTGKTVTGGTFTGGLYRAADGNTTLPGFAFGSDVDTGLYRKGTDNLGFVTAGTLRGEITSSGRLVWSAGASDTTLSVTATSSNSAAHGARIGNSSSGGGSGLIGIPSASGGWSFYAETGAYGPFTGAHPGLLRKDDEAEPGDILIDIAVIERRGIDDTVTEVARSSEAGQRAVIGVLSSRVPFDPDGLVCRGQAEHADAFDLATINALGEGQINVCGLGGDLEPGDLICTSDMPGKGQRQNDGDDADDLIRRYTVARVRERVTFDHPSDVKLVACIYLAG